MDTPSYGRDLGILWHHPFVADVTSAIVPGRNSVEVEVANRWINRIIGDEQEEEVGTWVSAGANDKLLKAFPEGYTRGRMPVKHYAFTTYRPYNRHD